MSNEQEVDKMDQDMTSSELNARPHGFSAPTMSANAPQGSNAAPNSQTPGHPSFRRFVVSCAYLFGVLLMYILLVDSAHQELARYEAIPLPLYYPNIQVCRGTEDRYVYMIADPPKRADMPCKKSKPTPCIELSSHRQRPVKNFEY